MELRDILGMGKDFLLIGIFLTVLLVAIFGIGYLVYRKIGKGKKKADKYKLLWWFVFICYILVVVLGTLLSRGSYHDGAMLLSPFFAYQEAWMSASFAAWGLIVVNIVLFVPFGFLLPLGNKKFQTFWKTYLAGFLFSLTIELIQLFFHLGIFETADLLNNTIGVCIGYGFYKIIVCFMSARKKEKISIKKTILFQIPLFLCIAGFGGTYIVYQMQELGNIPTYPLDITMKHNIDVTIHSSETYDTKEVNEMVYKMEGYTKEEAKQVAISFFDRMHTKINEDSVMVYDECVIYEDVDEKYNIWIYFKNGNININTLNIRDEENKQSIKASRETIEKALSKYGIFLPEGTTLTINKERQTYSFEADKIKIGDTLYDGKLECTYYENGELDNIRNEIIVAKPYKEFPLISQQEAFEKLYDEEFGFYDKDITLDVGKVHIGYKQDSKGYYQPVYVFDVKYNNEDTISQIMIPAVKK